MNIFFLKRDHISLGCRKITTVSFRWLYNHKRILWSCTSLISLFINGHTTESSLVLSHLGVRVACYGPNHIVIHTPSVPRHPHPRIICSVCLRLYIEGILPKGSYLPCVSMAGRALLAGYHRYHIAATITRKFSLPASAISLSFLICWIDIFVRT